MKLTQIVKIGLVPQFPLSATLHWMDRREDSRLANLVIAFKTDRMCQVTRHRPAIGMVTMLTLVSSGERKVTTGVFLFGVLFYPNRRSFVGRKSELVRVFRWVA